MFQFCLFTFSELPTVSLFLYYIKMRCSNLLHLKVYLLICSGNTKGGSITVLLTSCSTGLESAIWQLTIFIFLQNRLIQTGLTGGQLYSDTSPLVFPDLLDRYLYSGSIKCSRQDDFRLKDVKPLDVELNQMLHYGDYRSDLVLFKSQKIFSIFTNNLA